MHVMQIVRFSSRIEKMTRHPVSAVEWVEFPYGQVTYSSGVFAAGDFSIITSVHAVKALQNNQVLLSGCVFAVGAISAQQVKAVWPDVTVLFPEESGSEKMAELIASHKPTGRGVWYCGNIVNQDFLEALNAFCVIKKQVVYRMAPFTKSDEFSAYVASNKIDFMVFQSVQQVETVEKWRCDNLHHIRTIAISKRVQSALVAKGWTNVRVCADSSKEKIRDFCENWS